MNSFVFPHSCDGNFIILTSNLDPANFKNPLEHIKYGRYFQSAILIFVILAANLDSVTSKMPKNYFNF